jgi:hypothetical protein
MFDIIHLPQFDVRLMKSTQCHHDCLVNFLQFSFFFADVFHSLVPPPIIPISLTARVVDRQPSLRGRGQLAQVQVACLASHCAARLWRCLMMTRIAGEKSNVVFISEQLLFVSSSCFLIVVHLCVSFSHVYFCDVVSVSFTVHARQRL